VQEEDIMSNKTVFLLICLLLPFFSVMAYAEEAKKTEIYKEPQPYKDEEFPQWLKDLRRAEIIFFGSLPFSLLASLEGYEITRYLIHDSDPIYSPWPFKNPQSPPYTIEESFTVIAGALVISGIIAFTDYLIGKMTYRDEEKLRQP
jgi:hypothetical protein